MTEPVTGWTEDRVELLGKLWAEGLSASQIAGVLGGGVTRNAVIGKVHRLGLSGRGKTGQVAAARPPKPKSPASPPAEIARGDDAPERGDLQPEPVRDLGAVAPRVAEPQIPVSQRVSILELRDSMCRWPLGDPARADFGFCGGRAATGLPYCEAHCRIAYQPAAERKRLRA